ncbi:MULTISPECIES: hypothetical protein [unclassified Enterobacter]|uniref:hypothetical protein n=1 Tax=Enterobacter TaxID=547 RepID=UPI0038623617|nr:hypothetical protein [Enterobacter chengduensis]
MGKNVIRWLLSEASADHLVIITDEKMTAFHQVQNPGLPEFLTGNQPLLQDAAGGESSEDVVSRTTGN